MKIPSRTLKQVPVLLLLASCPAVAAITIPGITGTPAEGVDGSLNVSEHLTIDLSKSNIGTWDSVPASGTKGVYDPEKWAVIFKYSSVNITSGYTVRFKNNAARAPVVWLVSGDVTIDGALYLNGEMLFVSPDFGEPGPGGFRSGSIQGGAGFGPGGGVLGNTGASHRIAGSTPGAGPAYGDPEIRTLIGGSGGGTHYGAGAGAILIVATGKLIINGTIEAFGPLGGSGGAIRLVASEIDGSGTVDVRSSYSSPGFVRTEAESYGSANISVRPPDYSMATISGPISIWPEAAAPTARIVSVSNLPVPTDPKASLGLGPADVTVPVNGSRTVRIETRNFPTTGTVSLFVVPFLGNRSELNASVLPGGTQAVAFWEATLDPALAGRAALQVRAVAH